MAKVDQKKLDMWHDHYCSTCTKRKENRPKARCQIWHSLFVAKTPVALQNADKFLDQFGTCKGYEPKEVR